MAKSASEARQAYENGINDRMGGFGPYEEASRESTPKDAAETLENARSQRVDLNSAASAYENAYS